ncbi:hypothetical protein [Marinimicrobium sp. ARAG 43.8]|uniref:hypothetical protein n=1 Tax=Marinimicrobium sp. ARAG 43.8 TaxID=3418719 RepID=UPI003CF66EB4
MRVGLPVAAAILLSACAQLPSLPEPESCASLAPLTAMLHITRPGSDAQSLRVQGALEPAGYTWVVMNEVGVPGFIAVWENSDLKIETRPTYRGPQPEWLLWGLHGWQRAMSGAECEPTPGYEIESIPGGRQIWRGESLAWQWKEGRPNRFTLPIPEIDVTVRQWNGGDE